MHVSLATEISTTVSQPMCYNYRYVKDTGPQGAHALSQVPSTQATSSKSLCATETYIVHTITFFKDRKHYCINVKSLKKLGQKNKFLTKKFLTVIQEVFSTR